MRVRLLYPSTGKGLERDAVLLASLLSEIGVAVEIHAFSRYPEWRVKLVDALERIVLRTPRWLSARMVKGRVMLGVFRPKVDVNLFLQTINPSWLGSARYNFLMPNQEWFRPALAPWLDWVDCVMCKTHEAERAFAALGCKVEFTSFTSEDKYQEGVEKDYSLALHFAGAGLSKGTKPVLESWGRHPEWPLLLVTQREGAQTAMSANIRTVSGYLGDSDLANKQAAAGYYIGPSQVEGFGHALVEAMSACCIVVTTDAPPMNELIDASRGCLVPVSGARPLRLGTQYECSADDLEQVLEGVFAQDDEERKRLGLAAREWFIENDAFFRRRFVDVFLAVCPVSPLPVSNG